MRTALLLIDIQNDYFPGGKMELEGSLEACTQAARLLKFFRQMNWLTVHIQHVSTRPGATFFLPETDGVKFDASIFPKPGEMVITKHFPNSFRETGLHEYLKESDVERLVITGMMTHMCVDATVRAASDLGYSLLIAADACATCDLTYGSVTVPALQVHAAFLAAIRSTGQVLQTEDLLSMLTAG